MQRAERAALAARTRAELVMRVVTALNAGVELDEVLAAALEGCVLALGGHDGAILTVERTGTLRCVAELRPRGRVGARHPPVALAAERSPEWFTRGGAPEPPWFEDAGGDAALATPMFHRGECVGVVVVGFAGRSTPPDAEALALAEALADQCALALARAQLLADERRARDRIAGLQRVTAALSAAITREDVAAALHEEGLAAVGADVVLVLVRRGEQLELLLSHGVPAHELRELERMPLAAELPLTAAARSRRPLFLAGTGEMGRAFPAVVRDHAAWADAAWAVVPLLAGGDTLGVLALTWAARTLPFDPEERGFILALSAQCALALERVRLAEAERAARAEAQHAAAEARAVAEVQEHLMAVVGHDLRSPLQAIILSASKLLRGGGLDDAQAATVARISAASRRASALIADLLDFARARRGLGMRLSPAPADLGAICASVAAELREAHARRVLTVRCEGDVRGRWDPVRIAQLVQNLVTNALAHGGGAARVEVRARGERDAVLLSVWNDGPPLAAEELPHLFGPLGRGGRAASAGSGLGLFIVREIVLAHEGRIEVRSAEGEGTAFEVRLPRSAPGAA